MDRSAIDLYYTSNELLCVLANVWFPKVKTEFVLFAFHLSTGAIRREL